MVPDFKEMGEALIKEYEEAIALIRKTLHKTGKLSQPPEGVIVDGKLKKKSTAFKVLDGLKRITKDGTVSVRYEDALRILMERKEVAGSDIEDARLSLNKSIKQSRGAATLKDGKIHYDPSKRKSRVTRKYFTS